MATTIKLDHKAIGKILMGNDPNVDIDGRLDAVASAIAANVDVGSVTEAEVKVYKYKTDRTARSVVIAHPAGIAIEAKHGALRKAAASQGFEVHAPKRKKSK